MWATWGLLPPHLFGIANKVVDENSNTTHYTLTTALPCILTSGALTLPNQCARKPCVSKHHELWLANTAGDH